MNVLIIYDNPAVKPLADAIAQGVKELQAAVTIKTMAEKPTLGGFDFVFVGGVLDKTFSLDKVLSGQNVTGLKMALFCIKKSAGNLDGTLNALQAKGASIQKNTFSAQLEGPLAFAGVGKIKEADLIRARGYGERILNVAFGLEIEKDTQKADKIKGYLK